MRIIIDAAWTVICTKWIGTWTVFYWAVIIPASMNRPLLGLVLTWLAVWWCYANLEAGGVFRLIVGYLLWDLTGSYVYGGINHTFILLTEAHRGSVGI